MDEAKSGEVSADKNTITLDYWDNCWKSGQNMWQQNDGHPLLNKNLMPLLEKSYNSSIPKSLKVFVPLCGNSKDLITLYNLGFTVVGVEYVLQAVRELFDENKMEKVEENIDGAVFVRSTDNRLIIAVGDLFSFTPGQPGSHKLPHDQYDVTWDRGSMEAINFSDRERYSQMMISLMNPKLCNYLLAGRVYDKAEYGGPPTAITEEDLMTLYGKFCSVKIIDSLDVLAPGSPESSTFKSFGLTKMVECLYLLNPLSSGN